LFGFAFLQSIEPSRLEENLNMVVATFLRLIGSWARVQNFKTVALLLLLGVGFVGGGLAQAGTFSVTPVRIFLQPRDRATAITFTNDGTTEIVLQADLYEWLQKPNGDEDLKLAEDIIISPPIIKLAPGAKQVVRLARLNMAPNEAQQTYRLIVREIPEIAAAKQGISAQIALALSMPVFITPKDAKPDVSCTSVTANTSSVMFTCKNNGNAHAQVRHARVMRDGKELTQLDNGGYYLTGTQRMLTLPLDKVTAGTLTLELALDDGSSPSYTLQLAP
jgi:fimbrial chaperone protein